MKPYALVLLVLVVASFAAMTVIVIQPKEQPQPPGRYFYIVTTEGNVITPMGQPPLTQEQIAEIQNVPYIPYAGEFNVTERG